MLLILISFVLAAKSQDSLDQYIKRLKQSEASGGSETAFLSVGSTFLYGQGYFEKKEYDLANMYFMQAFQKDSTNAFVNYQIAASLLKQNNKYKSEEAQKYLQNAFRLNPALKTRFATEFPNQSSPEQTKAATNEKPDGNNLSKYIKDLEYSKANGGSKTAMNAPGLDVLYGYEHYQKGDQDLAAIRFGEAVTKTPDDIYANYLLGVSLAAQGLKEQAAPYLNKAFAGDASLRKQAAADIAAASAQFKKLKDSRVIKSNPATKPVYGGKLTFGNYMCTETVWHGANASQPFQPVSKGYFELKSNGTYRWLDNGVQGKYSYNPKTGEIKWLTGYFANMKAKTAQFQPGKNISQITVNFSDSYRWECGCKK
ncbi:MAG: hypothetical protein ACTHMD_07300 [Flavisolibacter sp.]